MLRMELNAETHQQNNRKLQQNINLLAQINNNIQQNETAWTVDMPATYSMYSTYYEMQHN